MTDVDIPLPIVLVALAPERRVCDVATNADFDQFFEDHFDDLVRSLTAITGDHARASDCVQEAFIKAYARWRRIRRYDNPVTWVRRIAINNSRDAHRSEARRRRREDRVHGTTGEPHADAAVETVASDLRLHELLAELTPRQRAVAALFYIEDISVSQIASSLGLSTGAVKFHLNKARKRLQVVLEREEVSNAR